MKQPLDLLKNTLNLVSMVMVGRMLTPGPLNLEPQPEKPFILLFILNVFHSVKHSGQTESPE